MNKLELIRLWMLGLGIPLSLLENKRVKLELDQKRIDGVGLLTAFQNGIYDVQETDIKEACKNLNNPRYQLELITLVNNGSMIMFG